MTTTARPRVHAVAEFMLDVYGWSGDGDELTKLLGWPQALKPIATTSVTNASGVILMWFSGHERKFTLEEACEVLNVLRRNNLGYSARVIPMFAYTRGSQVAIDAYLLSPNGRPQVLRRDSRRWVALTQGLLGAETIDVEPPEFSGDTDTVREVNDAFSRKVKLLNLAEIDRSLGG